MVAPTVQLRVSGDPNALQRWIDELPTSETGGWRRDLAVEQKARWIEGGRWPVCVRWAGDESAPPAVVFLHAKSPEVVDVANVVPTDRTELSEAEYGHILTVFETQVVKARGGGRLHSAHVSPVPALTEQVSPTAAARLQAFAGLANKTTLHPLDLGRWHDALIQFHRDEAWPDRSGVEAFLRSAGFPEPVVADLLRSFDLARDLLPRYDGAAGGR